MRKGVVCDEVNVVSLHSTGRVNEAVIEQNLQFPREVYHA